MKKIITLVTILAMMIMAIFAFSACGNKEEAATEEPAAESQTEEAVVEETNENNNLAGTTYVLKERYHSWEEGQEFEKDELNSNEPKTFEFNEDGTFTYTNVYSGGETVETGTYEVNGNQITINKDDSAYSTIPEEEIDAWKEHDKSIKYTIEGDSIIQEEKRNDIGSTAIPNLKKVYVKE